MNGVAIVWNLLVTLDRQVAVPGEEMHVSFTMSNPLYLHLYIDTLTWGATFYPPDQAVVQDAKKVLAPHGQEYLGAGIIRIPDVPDGQYQIDVRARTYVYDPAAQAWQDLGYIELGEPRRFLVVHAPRFRAFVSRSLRDDDRPVVEPMLHVIQAWGFDTHTVGINELEADPRRTAQRVIEEIFKADCLFAVATPRDVSAVTNLVHTLAWLNSEVSMAFVANKPLLILADHRVRLEGLPASPRLVVLPYDPVALPPFLTTLHNAMPIVRGFVERHLQGQLAERVIHAERIVAYGAFIAGTIHRQLPG